MESPSSKKPGLKKRLLRFFSKSEGNLKEKARSRSEGDKSPAAHGEGHLERKGWSEKRGRKSRNEAEDGAHSLPRLRHPKSEDPVPRRTSRESKTRSLSYSELELPASSLLQRFGSLTWRKKRFSVLEYSEEEPTVSSPTESQWSVGRLDRPAVGSDMDLENRRPKSCIAETHFSELTPKNPHHSSSRTQEVQRTLEVSTSFDCLADDDGDHHSCHVVSKRKNVQLQLPFAFPEKLEGDEEDSLPCWAKSILKNYLSPDHYTLGSLHYPLSGDSHNLEVLEKSKEPQQYQSPLYHRMSRDIIQEETFEKSSPLNTRVFSNEDAIQFNNPLNASSCSEMQKEHNQSEVQQNLCYVDKEKEDSDPTGNLIPLYTSILSQDVSEKQSIHNVNPLLFQNLPQEGAHNNTFKSKSPDPLCFSPEYSIQKGTSKSQTSLHHTNSPQEGLQKERSLVFQDPFQDQTQNIARHIYSSYLGQEAVQNVAESCAGKDHSDPQTSPSTTKIRYQVIITMTKEEREQLPGLVPELVKGEELVGQDLRLSPSLESQACGFHGAGQVTAQAVSEALKQTEKNTAQEEEIPTKRRGGQTCEGEQLDRSLCSAVDEELPFSILGSEQVAEYCRLNSSEMEKHDKLQKDYNCLSKRAQSSRMFEIQSSYEPSTFSNKKDDSAEIKKLSSRLASPQPFVGHVKGLQKVFEDISSKEEVIQQGATIKSKQYGSLRKKNHSVPQGVSIVPGVHGPVYSQVYNPLKKDHLEKRREYATVSVIDSAAKLYPSLKSPSHMDNNTKCAETKGSSSKDIVEIKLAQSCHNDNETKHRHARHPLQDLQLPPRTPTPPPQRTKNNVSISLRSPKGWKNESGILRSPKVFLGQQFENQADGISPMPSQTSGIFLFTRGNVSNTMSDSELKQKVRNTEQNRYVNSPGEINKSHSTVNSHEDNKAKMKTSFHPNVSAKETTHTTSSEKAAAIIKNENKGKYEAQKDSGHVNEYKNKISDLGIAERVQTEATYNERHTASVILISGDQEEYVEETIKPNKIQTRFRQDIPPIITQRRRHKLNTTEREKLEGSKGSNNQNVIRGMVTNSIAEKDVDVGTSNENRTNTEEESSTESIVKILRKVVTNVNHNSVQLNKDTDKEIGYYETSSIKQPLMKESISNKGLSPKHKAKERKPTLLTHSELGIKSNLKTNVVLSTTHEDKSTTMINQGKAITDHAVKEQVAVMSDKRVYATNQGRDIMVQAYNKIERTTNVVDIAVNEIDAVPIDKESIDQPTIDMIEYQTGHVLNKTVDTKDLDKTRQYISVLAASVIDSSNQPVKNIEDLMDRYQNAMVSVTTNDGLNDNSSNLQVEMSSDETTIDVIEDQIEDFRRITVDMKDQTEQEIVVLVDSFKNSRNQLVNNLKEESANMLAEGTYMSEQNIHSDDFFFRKTLHHRMDPNLIVTVEDLMDQVQNVIVNVEIKQEPMENFSDLPNENSAVNINEDQTEEVDKKTAFMKNQTGQEVVVLVESFIDSSDQPVNNLKEESTNLLTEVGYRYEQNINSNDFFSRETIHKRMHMDPNLIVRNQDLMDQDHNCIVKMETEDELMEHFSDLPDGISAVNITENQTEEVDEKTIVMKDQTEHEVVSLVNSSTDFSDQPVNNLKEESTNLLTEVEYMYEQNINSDDFFSRNNMHQIMHSDPYLIVRVKDLMDKDQNFTVNVETKDEPMENATDLPGENSPVNINAVNIIEDQAEEVEKKTIDMKDQTGQENIVLVESYKDSTDHQLNSLKEESTNMLDKVEDLAQPKVISHNLPDTHLIYQKEDVKDLEPIKEKSTEKTKVIENYVDQATDMINQYVNNIVMEKTAMIAEDHISETINHSGNTIKQSDDIIPAVSTKSVLDEVGVICDQDKDVILKQCTNELVDQAGEVVLDRAGDEIDIPSLEMETLTVDFGNWTSQHKLNHIMDRARMTVHISEDPDDVVITKEMSSEKGSGQTNEDQVDHTNDENNHLGNIKSIILTTNVFEEVLGDGNMDQAGKEAIIQTSNVITDLTKEVMHNKKEDALDSDFKIEKLTKGISDQICDHEVDQTLNEIFKSTLIMNSTNEQPGENSNGQLSDDTANQFADMMNQFGKVIDVVSSKEDQAEHENNDSHAVTLQGSEVQSTLNLPQTNNIQEGGDGKYIEISDHIVPVIPSKKLNGEVSGILFSGAETRSDTDDERCKSVPSAAVPLQENHLLPEQATNILQQLPNVEKNYNEAGMEKNATHCAEEEETESSENMEIWVNKVRHLETPEFMKYQREPRQPRSSPLSMYATLPPIKEDQGSPKSNHSDIKWHLQEKKEKQDLNPLPSQCDSILEAKVIEKSDESAQTEKKYIWERNTERVSNRSSPLELMRKHTGDEVSRSESYKAFITQNLSQRQSSIIGSLLLSDRLDKKTEAAEGKSYSRIESSFLLSNYMKPKKDKLQETPEETDTPTQEVSSTDATIATTANDTLASTLEDPQPVDNKDPSHPQLDDVTDSDSSELPSKLDTPVSSPFKVFSDVWNHPGKSHGKLNPRPGKIILFSEPEFRGHSHEIYSDVGHTSDWELQGSISVRIVRGGWLLYEKSNFRGRRVMLAEGGTDLTCPWEIEDKSIENLEEGTKETKFWIGSLRHVVRDFQVPRISLFMNENGEGNKLTIVGATPDSRICGQPTKTQSIIVHSGLWLVYSKPFFEGDPYILESGGYPNRTAWNGQDSHLCSLQPARIGGPTVEKPNEPKILLFQFPGFEGHRWEVTRDLHSLQGEPNSEGERLNTVGSLKVQGGCWVGYEKEGFRGHQYLLEEGEYKEWSSWGGCTEELASLRHIHTDFSVPEIVLYEKPGCLEGPCLRLNEALADIEEAQYGTSTGSIHVLNGVWVAYENVDFSGEQYILEKGIYHSYQDWGAKDSQVCSVQPVLQVGGQSLHYFPKIQLFSEANFHGDCITYVEDHVLLPENFSPQSCRIDGGSWSLYEGEDCHGEQYILAEGDYPTRTAMGCQAFSMIRSLKKVPLYFSIPSISLHGLERFEGKELEFTGEVRSLQGEGYNNHVLSVKVQSGIWVLYEHNDFRGRQWLLEHTQIPNWLLYSGLQRIGSLCPIRQRRVYFRLRNRALGLFLCVPEPDGDMKAARVQVTVPQEGSCDLWYYEEGRIKNQLAPQMSLQVVGMSCPGTKVVLWSEGRKPIQTWSLEDSGLILSCLFEGLCLDIKGGHSYDSDHVVVWEADEDRLTQRWDLEVF